MEVQQFVSLTPWTLIFQICNLLILMLLMKKFLFKPVQNILNKRQQEIDEAYAAAESDKSLAAEMKDAYFRRMIAARTDADKLVSDAKEEAKRQSNEILDVAHYQASLVRQKAEAEIALQRMKVFNELKRDLSGMAVDIAEQMVSREINEEDQAALVEDFLRNAGDEQ